jgi:hypothetical protein
MSQPLLRETPHYLCTASPRRGWVRITCKDRSTKPPRLTVAPMLWKQLQTLSDREFDASCILELGIGSRI